MADAVQLERLAQQLVELQTQVAFQEDTIAALDAVVTAQQRQLDDLQGRCKRQQEALDGLRETVDKVDAEPPPPHY